MESSRHLNGYNRGPIGLLHAPFWVHATRIENMMIGHYIECTLDPCGDPQGVERGR